MRVALLICLGFVLGGLIGAQFAVELPELTLKRVFGIAMLLIALRMILSK